MRADTGTPELGITGVDLASLVPAGNGAMRMQCESSGACGVPSETDDTRDAEIHVTALQVGVTIAQTRIYTKKIVR
jgi:hypothetical protein